MPIRPTTSGPATRTRVDPNAADSRTTGAPTAGAAAKADAPFGDAFAGSTTDPKVKAAVDTYRNTIETILKHDVMSMARGDSPARSSSDLTGEQRTQLQKASKAFISSMPLRALSPKAAVAMQETLQANGVKDWRKAGDATVGEVPGLASALGKKFYNDFKQDHPGAYYGIAATAALAAGYAAYDQGSEVLDKLGIKPEFKTKVFDDTTKLSVKGKWDEKFSNPDFRATTATTLKGEDGTLSFGTDVRVKGSSVRDLQFEHVKGNVKGKLNVGENLTANASLSGDFRNRDGDLSAHGFTAGVGLRGKLLELQTKAKLDGSGGLKSTHNDLTFRPERGVILGLGVDTDADLAVDRYRLSASYTRKPYTLKARASLDADGSLISGGASAAFKLDKDHSAKFSATVGSAFELTEASAGLVHREGNWDVGGAMNYSLKNDTFGGELSAGYRKDNLRFGAVAGSDGTRGNYVGVGLKLNF